MVVQNRYTRACESPSPSRSPSEDSPSSSDDLSPGPPPPDEDMYPDQPEYTFFEIIVGVTPHTVQCIRLYFHRLWQIEAPISFRFQDAQIVTGNLSSMITVSERWALACLHKDEEAGMPLFSKNRLNKAVCDAGLKEYEKATEIDARDFISHLKDLRNAIQDVSYRIEDVARVIKQDLEPCRTVLNSCIENLIKDWYHGQGPSIDSASVYLKVLGNEKRGHWKCASDSSINAKDTYLRPADLVTMNLPDAIRNLEHYLTIALFSLEKMLELDFQLFPILRKLNLTGEKYAINRTELLWARLSLRHLQGEAQRRSEELEAFQVLLKCRLWRRYGRAGREYVAKLFPDLPETFIDTLDVPALISIALGIEDSETARRHMGGLWQQIGRSNGGRDFDVSFPCREKQREALRFAAGGRFRGLDSRDI
ncbi:hypothetical protein J7337_011182 [Fusarium musae]|uniref:Uncharacterized protein n=1 Tax=Fusarium musae TaxID=1042133 RepID=A0A9P8DAK0_9HYPO|nr:hypothetical protein J7337_011182 [Fusarium musae]KAG9498286.1 hypothetical protein J7337_011182 [Fusarium musae]